LLGCPVDITPIPGTRASRQVRDPTTRPRSPRTFLPSQATRPAQLDHRQAEPAHADLVAPAVAGGDERNPLAPRVPHARLDDRAAADNRARQARGRAVVQLANLQVITSRPSGRTVFGTKHGARRAAMRRRPPVADIDAAG
jgi:hypothetical protein